MAGRFLSNGAQATIAKTGDDGRDADRDMLQSTDAEVLVMRPDGSYAGIPKAGRRPLRSRRSSLASRRARGL